MLLLLIGVFMTFHPMQLHAYHLCYSNPLPKLQNSTAHGLTALCQVPGRYVIWNLEVETRRSAA